MQSFWITDFYHYIWLVVQHKKTIAMDDNLDLTNQNLEYERINREMIQDMEQQRVQREMMQDSGQTNNKGWIVLVVFVILVACMLAAFAANAQNVVFADREVEGRAMLNGDTDGDGYLSKAECDSLKSLNLTSYRTHLFLVSTYDDLAKFPNLEKIWLGESRIDTVDLSKNWKLKFVCVQSDSLKTLILAVGCTPTIHYPLHSGEITVKRVLNPDAPGAMFFQY